MMKEKERIIAILNLHIDPIAKETYRTLSEIVQDTSHEHKEALREKLQWHLNQREKLEEGVVEKQFTITLEISKEF